MALLRYSELSDIEIEFIVNGCGGKGSFISVPNFLFLASCKKHDFYYWRGATVEDKRIADDSFYKWMKKDIDEMYEMAFYKKLFYKFWAWSYYRAVVIKGKKYFSYRDRPKTRAILEYEMKNI